MTTLYEMRQLYRQGKCRLLHRCNIMKRLAKQTRSARGFPMVEFEDSYGEKCSLQASSLAKYQQPGISAVWLGIDSTRTRTSWPSASTRMHLERNKVEALINHLKAWLDSEDGQFQ